MPKSADRIIYNVCESIPDGVKRDFPYEYVVGLGPMRMRTKAPLVSL